MLELKLVLIIEVSTGMAKQHTLHAARIEIMDLVIELIWRNPESELAFNSRRWLRDCIDLLLGADDGLGLYSGHVLGVGPGQEAVVILGKWNQDALLDKIILDLEMIE